jgi:hypothetical protein
MDENMDMRNNDTNRTPTRIRPIVLALVVSVVAALAAVTAHVVFGVGETPIVIGTLVVASIAGWLNAETGVRATVTPLDGRRSTGMRSAA